MRDRESTCTLYPTRMSWKGQLTWISRKATFKDAEDVDTSFASYTRPGCPGRVGRPGFPGRSPYATRRAFTRPSRHLHPTRMSWKGGPTWISRKVILCDAKGGDSPLASPTPDQDVLEGWTHLDFQGGHLMRREGCSHALRVTYTRPGCPGRVGRPGCPGRLPSKTRKTLTRLSHLTPDQDVLEGWADLDFQEGHPMRREGCSHALRVTHTRPGCPGRVDPPGFPGRSPYATRRAVIRPSRHLHPTRMSWKGGPTWISRGVTIEDAEDVDTSIASYTQPGCPGRVRHADHSRLGDIVMHLQDWIPTPLVPQ